MGQTENLSRVMRERSEDLQDGPMSKLTILIKDKQQLRKSYGEQWTLLSQEHCKVTRTHTHARTRTLYLRTHAVVLQRGQTD